MWLMRRWLFLFAGGESRVLHLESITPPLKSAPRAASYKPSGFHTDAVKSQGDHSRDSSVLLGWCWWPQKVVPPRTHLKWERGSHLGTCTKREKPSGAHCLQADSSFHVCECVCVCVGGMNVLEGGSCCSHILNCIHLKLFLFFFFY